MWNQLKTEKAASQRQISEHEKRVGKSRSTDDAEEMSKQGENDACEEIPTESRSYKKEIAKKDAEIQAKLFSSFKEITEKVKRMETKDDTQPRENAWRGPKCATLYNKCSSVPLFQDWLRLGVWRCSSVCAEFKITQPYFI